MIFKNVAIESLAYILPPHRITSAELDAQIAPTLKRLGIPPGRIEALAGIEERRFWDAGVQPSEVATMAAEKAIAEAGIDRAEIGLLINTSVCRDYIEPSTACLVHGNLGLAPSCLNYDLSNACLGFLNGMRNAALMIEAGIIKYALIVAGEGSRDVIEATIARLLGPEVDANYFKNNFATLTLGSSAVAMVLCHKDVSKTTHRLESVIERADTTNNRLCIGTPTHMTTDASALLVAGTKLAVDLWKIAEKELPDWNDAAIDLYAPHQVGARHMEVLVKAMGLPLEKFILNFQTLGNLGPPAVPVSLAQAVETGRLKEGQRAVLLGIGSGINCSFMSVRW